MSNLPSRDRSALMVIDVQTGVVEAAFDRNGVVGRIASLVERARADDVPVLWVQHHDDDLVEGSASWQIVEELNPLDGEPVVSKAYGDAFEDTDLEERLAERAIGRLVVVGAQTDACIRSTIHGALARGYDVELVSDAHTTEDLTAYGAPPPEQVIAHTNLYWSFQSAPGRATGVSLAAEVELT